jgi:hypothetical protein
MKKSFYRVMHMQCAFQHHSILSRFTFRAQNSVLYASEIFHQYQRRPRQIATSVTDAETTKTKVTDSLTS